MSQPWTREGVEAALVAAFGVLPGRPMIAVEGGLVAFDRPLPVAALTAWKRHLDDDPDARKYLWAWARCRATGVSFAALCREIGWPQTTAEVGRRRGATTLAQRLPRHPS